MQHIDELTLELYALGSEKVREQCNAIEKHLAECPGCTALYEEMKSYREEVEQRIASDQDNGSLPVIQRSGLEKYRPRFADIRMYEKSLPVKVGLFIAQHRYISSSVGVVALLLLGFMLFFRQHAPKDLNPSYSRVKNEFLVVYNAQGEELWRKHVSPSYDWEKLRGLFANSIDNITKTVDVNGDGINEVVAVFPRDADTLGKWVYCFNADASIRWAHPLHRRIQFGNEDMTNDYEAQSMLVGDSDHGQRPHIMSIATHRLYYPRLISELNLENGALQSEYWHSGGLVLAGSRDIDSDGIEELIFVGENNGYDRAIMLILDPRSIVGHSPSTSQCVPHNVPEGKEKWYIVFPRNDLDTFASFKRSIASSIEFLGNGTITVSVRNRVENIDSFVLYHFDSSMKCIRVDGGDGFVQLHRELEKEGKLSRKLDDRYYEDLRKGIRYWDGERFVPDPTMNKRYLDESKRAK